MDELDDVVPVGERRRWLDHLAAMDKLGDVVPAGERRRRHASERDGRDMEGHRRRRSSPSRDMYHTSMSIVGGFGLWKRNSCRGEAPSLSMPTRAAVAPSLHLAGVDAGEQGEAEAGSGRKVEAREREKDEAGRRGSFVQAKLADRELVPMAGERKEEPYLILLGLFTF